MRIMLSYLYKYEPHSSSLLFSSFMWVVTCAATGSTATVWASRRQWVGAWRSMCVTTVPTPSSTRSSSASANRWVMERQAERIMQEKRRSQFIPKNLTCFQVDGSGNINNKITSECLTRYLSAALWRVSVLHLLRGLWGLVPRQVYWHYAVRGRWHRRLHLSQVWSQHGLELSMPEITLTQGLHWTQETHQGTNCELGSMREWAN